MSNVKISALPVGVATSSTPFPAVVAGVTDQVTLAPIYTSLAGKAALSHTHPESDITNLSSDLSGLTTRVTTLEGTVGGRLFETTTTVSNPADATEDTLHTYTLAAGKLANANDAIRIRTWVSCAANFNTKRIKVIFGGTTIGDSTQQQFNGVGFMIDAYVFRTGAATQKALCGVVQPNFNAAWNIAAGGGLNLTTPAETLSGTVVIKVTGQSIASAAADVSAYATTVDYLPGV